MKKLLALLSIIALNTQATDTLLTRQWGLFNKGQTLLVDDSEFSRREIKGIEGIDIEWTDIEVPAHRKAVVAVVDTGVDIFHPDLKGRFWQNKKTCPELPESNEEKIEKACHGYNAFKRDRNVIDDDGHGTHVAGIIAANKNEFGVRGAAHQNVLIMPVKVLDPMLEGYVYTENNRRKLITDVIADGIIFAVKNEADVVNLSLGFPSLVETQRMRDAIAYAKRNNVAIVAAAGNNNKEIPIYPCTYEDVICVGSYGVDGLYSEFSNYGGKVDILAPGDQIVSTYPATDIESDILRIKGYESLKGTSQAAPFISAILANMRLLDPRIGVDAMKAKLYSSAIDIVKGDKFSKFARASMKKALAAEPKTFLSPSYKNLLDVKYDTQSKTFEFELPIKNYLKTVSNIEVKTVIESEALKLDNTTNTIETISGGETKLLKVKGKIVNELADNNAKLVVTIKVGEFTQTTATTLMFARTLNQDNFISVAGNGLDKLLHAGGRRSFFIGNFVSDPHRLLENPIVYTDSKVDRDIDVSLLTIKKDGPVATQLKLKNYHQLLGIFANDTNLDGKTDLFVYGMDLERKNLIFEFLNLDGSAVISQNRWYFPISEFEGLPISRSRKEQFSWVKTQTRLGQLMLPAIYKYYKTPELDQTDDFLDERPEAQKKYHLYYFEPVTSQNKITVNLRAINSDDFIDDLIEKYDLPWNELIHLENPSQQTALQRRRGEIQGMFSIGQHTNKKYISLTIANTKSIQTISFRPNNDISNNSLVTMFDNKGAVQGNAFIRRNNKRNEVRIDLGQFDREDINFNTGLWSDPIFEVISGHDKNKFFINSRYYIHAISNEYSLKLPINRDSTFQETQFSESFSPINAQVENTLYPAIYIDSTMIFGDRLYSMVFKDDSFIRPFFSSVGIPRGCANMGPKQLKNEDFYSYLLICKRENKIELGIVPINWQEVR